MTINQRALMEALSFGPVPASDVSRNVVALCVKRGWIRRRRHGQVEVVTRTARGRRELHAARRFFDGRAGDAIYRGFVMDKLNTADHMRSIGDMYQYRHHLQGAQELLAFVESLP